MTRDNTSAQELAGTDLVHRMGHDFNNLISIVLGGLSLLREEVEESAWSADCEETYRDVTSAAREAAEVIARLTAWAGRQALDPQHLDVNMVLQEAAALARQGLAPSVTIEVAPCTPCLMVWSDRIHLRAALGELLNNARDAIDSQGVIRLEAGCDTVPWVCVIDDGCGMTAEVLTRCREPFYTTRRDFGRRGLGLSVVDGFARASHGALVIESEPGRGTRAMIRLPEPVTTAV